MRILLTGKNGQLGWELHRFLEREFEVIAVGRHEVNFMSPYGLQENLRKMPSIDLIINAAAYTDVDRAEREFRIADLVNTEAPEILAMEAQHRNIPLIHFSTDYIFDGQRAVASQLEERAALALPLRCQESASVGRWYQPVNNFVDKKNHNKRPYTESDKAIPLNAYGRGKLQGEHRVRDHCEKHLIFRLSGLYGIRRRNFFTTVLKAVNENRSLNVVDDQAVSPNWCPMVAEAIRHVVDKVSNGFQEWGTYHLSGNGCTNWCEFARLIYTHAADVWDMPKNSPIPIHSEDYAAEATRPSFSVLNSNKFEITFGHSLPDWHTQFLHCINSVAR